MLDAHAGENTFRNIHDAWVAPELKKRSIAGTLPSGFRIRRCLVKLPRGKEPIVQFNEEITWIARVKKPIGIEFAVGDPIFISQVEHVETVDRPTVDGKPVAFFFVYWTGTSFRIVFDCSPNIPGECQEDGEARWEYGEAIAEAINLELRELAVKLHDAHRHALQDVGLWAAPALVPYPLSVIADECGKGDLGAARRILVTHCTSDFLDDLVSKWGALPAFASRHRLFVDALAAHRIGQFTLSVSALMPHIEGVMTDWVLNHVPAEKLPWRQDSKTKMLRDLLQGGQRQAYAEERIAECALDFILNGPVLSTFKDWLGIIDDDFPNRNVVGHGKYVDAIYTEENSIKAFLMLDTLFHVMSVHDAASPDVQ